MKSNLFWIGPFGMALTLFGLMHAGCRQGAIFNPAFTNTTEGGIYPLTPGPNATYILVRAVNDTDQVVEFVVTIEREVFAIGEDGTIQFEDANGNGVYDVGEPLITRSERKTVNLTTNPLGNANDIGVLFDCGISLITKIGLGENLLPTDAAVFVGGEGAGGAAGFGVTAGDLYPLLQSENNFDCGDTVIFQAVRSSGSAGGVALQSLLLPNSEQPDSYSGADTFVNYDQFLESQVSEEGP